MAGVQITLDGFGDATSSMDEMLSLYMERIDDLRPVNELQAETLEEEIRKQFYTQGQHFGTPWADYWPDEPKYGGRKRGILKSPRATIPKNRWIRGKPQQPPQPGEILYPSFFRGRPGNVWRSEPRGFVWGTAAEHAARVHGGGPQKWDGINHPARPILRVENGTRSRPGLRKLLINNVQAYVESSFSEWGTDGAGRAVKRRSGNRSAAIGKDELRRAADTNFARLQ